MTIDLARFHAAFFEESFEGLDAMESSLLALDPGTADKETINAIFRAAHSIKGGSATFGFSAVAAFTHILETLLDQMRSGVRPVAQPLVDQLLGSVDAVRELLEAARDGREANVALIAAHQNALAATLANTAAPAAAVMHVEAPASVSNSTGFKIEFTPVPSLFRSGNDPRHIFRELASLGTLNVEAHCEHAPKLGDKVPEDCHLNWVLTLTGNVDEARVREAFAWVEDECHLVITALEAAPASKPVLTLIEGGKSAARNEAIVPPSAMAHDRRAGDRRQGGPEGSSIRVSTEKIDQLINLVGELVITQAMLAQQAGVLDPIVCEKLLGGLSQLDRNTRQLQESVMSIRMLPMEFVFSRFPRMVHDLAGQLGKQVRLITLGESTELDKGLIEKIADPLTHLVRNSLDHGIETVEARIAAGKDPVGTVRLSAAHQGGSIVIEISDDGRGLNRERILAKARESGLNVSDTMSDSEVWQLIFANGFSTAEVVTDVSGRGVGMDVVKKNILSLGGQVDLQSVAGKGATVTIRLPLTLAILDGMSIRVGEEIFIVPLNCVVESLQPTADQVKPVAGAGRVVKVRSEYLPLVSLSNAFRIPAEHRDPTQGVLVLVEAEGKKIALQVDELVAQQQVVIKSLEANYKRVFGISGATILGDGRVALILDVGSLVRDLHQRAAA
ncbi:MAG: chemotaxis protein CheW [Pseudomonadota bacterium]